MTELYYNENLKVGALSPVALLPPYLRLDGLYITYRCAENAHSHMGIQSGRNNPLYTEVRYATFYNSHIPDALPNKRLTIRDSLSFVSKTRFPEPP